jgi:hypothetical protein
MKQFISLHEGAKSLAEAAEATGLTVNSHQARASKYRSEFGIPLQQFSRGGGARLDVDKALAIVAELRGVSIEEIQAEQAALQAAKAERAEKRAAKLAEATE